MGIRAMSKHHFHIQFDEDSRDEYIIPEWHRKVMGVLSHASKRMTELMRPMLGRNQEEMYIRNHRRSLINTELTALLHPKLEHPDMERRY